MSRASLLSMSDPWFDFEHAMAHRNALAVIYPLQRFSVVPYFIEPEQNVERRAGKWHLNHQQAHTDALNNFPSRYYWPPTTMPQPPPLPPIQVPATVRFGLRVGGNLIDTSFADERQRRWWE